ncbi:hypothetical protein FD755_024449 [Muntiacus reevesi]|uniref:Immunoglobulin domain-containing protein n=1 Tax=Muntiacus reevesi TaxID=9886 RepID=A0A5N3VC39_MUNRE|nr:hypothetical protein FD755_024449 [Muntiacus reevesi]
MEIVDGMWCLSQHPQHFPLRHPILEVPQSVTGPWKGDVNIPCTYGPLQGYTQVLVKWLVERGSDSVTIFLRDLSGDHIQQAKYRGRLRVNHEVPGDVSLHLNTLEMDDRSHYTCEVTWQTPDGNQVVKDKIIELRVQKLYVCKPTLMTGSGYGFTVPKGMRISLQCQAWGSPLIIPIKVGIFSILLLKSAVVDDSGSYFCTIKGWLGFEQHSNTVKFVVKGLTSFRRLSSEPPEIFIFRRYLSLDPWVGKISWRRALLYSLYSCYEIVAIYFGVLPYILVYEKSFAKITHLSQQTQRRLYTWTSPDGQYRNQIDYILCSQRWRSSIQSAKTRPGIYCG